jgi:hypothetical protein
MWDFTSKIRQNWEPIQRYLAFDFGTAIHAALEEYYDPITWGNRDLMEAYATNGFISSFAELSAKVKVGDIVMELEFREAATLGLRMLEYYFWWAPQHDNFRPVMREIEFDVEIPGMPGVHYQGRIDLLIEVFDDEGNSLGYYIVDHKTAKQMGDTLWLALDDQCSSYAWALQKMLGIQIRGVMYNQLKKKPPSPPKKLVSGAYSRNKTQDTDFITYLRTLEAAGINPRHYREFLLFLKQNPKEYIRRTKIPYTQRTLEIVEQRIQKEAKEMLNPDVTIYPTPSFMNCPGCRFFAPCLQLQEGYEPSMDMYEVRK